MSHLGDNTHTPNMSLAKLLQQLQDVDVTVNCQQPRVSDPLAATIQQETATDQQETTTGQQEQQRPEGDI